MQKPKRKRGHRSQFNIGQMIDEVLVTCAVCVWSLMFYLLAYIPGQIPAFTHDFVSVEENAEVRLLAKSDVPLLSASQQGFTIGAGSHFMSLLGVGMMLILVQGITRLIPAPTMQHSHYSVYWNSTNRVRYVPP